MGQLIREELGRIILQEIKDPRIRSLEITRVRVTPDLREAFVSYRLVGQETERRSVEEALTHARGFFQNRLGKTLALRLTPVVRFEYDTSLEEAIRIEELLEKTKKD